MRRLAQQLADTHTQYRTALDKAAVEKRGLSQQLLQVCVCLLPLAVSIHAMCVFVRVCMRFCLCLQMSAQKGVETSPASGSEGEEMDRVTTDLDRVAHQLEASRVEVRALREQITTDMDGVSALTHREGSQSDMAQFETLMLTRRSQRPKAAGGLCSLVPLMRVPLTRQ